MTTTKPETKIRKVPATALQARVGACEFAAGDPAKPMRGPIKLTASSGTAFNHPWWGRLVFDYSGMRWTNGKLTLDYCHWSDEVLGYADSIENGGGKLTVSGELISVRPDDRSAEVLAKGQAGVPYEASIKFDPYNELTIEEVQAGMTAVVNGQVVQGPVTVLRTCLLRGVAVCPYGADPYTQSEFSQRDGGEMIDVAVLVTQEQAMKPAENLTAETPEQIAARVQSELSARIADYTTRFGQQGQAWALSNRPQAECYADLVAQLREHHATELAGQKATHDAAVTELQGKLTAAETKATELQARIDSASLGEGKPVSSAPAEGNGPAELSAQEQAALGPSLAKFVAAQRRAAAKK